jgi:hypothetical protein
VIGRRHGAAHPARVRIKKPPVDAVVEHVLHLATAIEEYSQHALPQLDDSGVLLCLGRFRGVVGHGVLLGYRRYDERRVEVHERRAQ